MNNIARLTTAALLVLVTVACDDSSAPEGQATARRDAPDAEALAVLAAAAPTPRAHRAPPGGDAAPTGRELRAAPGAKAAFSELEELLAEHYVDGPIGEDAFYTAAAEGVLDRLIQLPAHPINTLMSPEELAELEVGTQGKLLGIGVVIERVADVVVIREALPGSPAEAAGLKRGDRILGIDGERIAGLDLAEIVARIRGADGTELELFVQRDTEEWDQKLTRGQIDVPSVAGEMLDDDTGYLSIRSFGKNTANEVDAVLAAHTEAGADSLVLDLRKCPGGLLGTAIEVSSRFLPAGQRIVSLERRTGEPKHHLSEGESPWQKAPLVVLVGTHTASGAEILAAAIKENDRGVIVGETTMGKATVESIHELSNDWAVKMSVMRFYSPSPEGRDVHRVHPDIRVPADIEGARGGGDTVDPSVDAQLGAAIELLETRRR